MHSLLENYLSEVAVHLSALPPKRCDDELREMRTHLENAVIVNRELGQLEDEAAQNAVEQFGTPLDLAENVVWAWQRGQSHNRRSFFGAVVSSLVLLNTVPYLMIALTCMLVVPFAELMRGTYHWPAAAVIAFCFFSVDLPTWLLIGAACGRFFPKMAIAGTGFVMMAWIVLRIAQSFWVEFVEIPDLMVHGYFHQRSDYRSAEDITLRLFLDVLLALAATVSAWTGSRWRNARAGRARLARG